MDNKIEAWDYMEVCKVEVMCELGVDLKVLRGKLYRVPIGLE